MNSIQTIWRKAGVLLAVLSIGLLSACDPAPSSSSGSAPTGQATSEQASTSTQEAADPTAEASTARNVYVVFDGSGSMGDCPPKARGNCESKIVGAKRAVHQMVAKLPDDVNLGLYVFDGNGREERVPLGPNNKKQFLAEIDKIDAGSGTPLGQATSQGIDALKRQYAHQLGYGEYRLVVVTDGEPDSMGPVQDAMDQMRSSKAPIALYTIGFGIDDPDHPLRKYSATYTAADTAAQVQDALVKATSELDSYDEVTFQKK